MPKISVIVPIYKVEKFCDRCIKSIIAQTFSDFELVLVDDGSPDNCPQMCDDWAKKDKRIHVIHKPNRGLSDARNAGIDWTFANSNSQWIAFIDGDDWIHPEYLETLYNSAKTQNTDISLCCFVNAKDNNAVIENEDFSARILAPEELYVSYRVTSIVTWGKLYKKECFENVRFPKDKLHEDEFTIYKILFKSKYLSFIPATLYFYFQNTQGIMNSQWETRKLDKLDALYEQTVFFKENGFLKAEVKASDLYMSFSQRLITALLQSNVKTSEKEKLLDKYSNQLKSFLSVRQSTYPAINYPWHYLAAYDCKALFKSNRGRIMPKISIIVPVYKSEDYLSSCIKSILAQNFTDFELILVEDGSPDNSGNLCDEYAKTDARIKVIHQENKGASAARNRGITESTGEYLMFCDSDDIVSPMWIERLFSLADPETLVIGSSCNDEKFLGKEKNIPLNPKFKYEKKDYYIFNQNGIAGFLWNAIYHADVVKNNMIFLREKASAGDYNEDLIFNLQYVSKINNIVYTGYSDYYYNFRNDSLSHSFDKNYFAKYSEKYRLWREYINEHCGTESEYLKDLSTNMLYHFLVSLQNKSENKQYKEFKETVLCEEMQEVLQRADLSKENPKIIKKIKNKQVRSLYFRYLLQNIKRRCKK